MAAEGAGILVLEDLSRAIARGATILAEVIGYGASADAYHIVAPDAQGMGAAKAMQWALDDASLSPGEVDYINAHGTSTPLNDAVETLAIKRVFGENAYAIPVSSTKSMIGHLMGAAGGIEAVICVQTLLSQVIAPTINYETPDPDCDLDYVPNVARPASVRVAMSNSFGLRRPKRLPGLQDLRTVTTCAYPRHRGRGLHRQRYFRAAPNQGSPSLRLR